jgi:hypothetical protein
MFRSPISARRHRHRRYSRPHPSLYCRRGGPPGSDMSVDVEHALLGRGGEPFGEFHVVEEQRPGAEIGAESVDEVRSHCSRASGLLLGRSRSSPGFHDHVVRPVKGAALKAIGERRDVAVRLLAGTRGESCSQTGSRPWRSRVKPWAQLVGSANTDVAWPGVTFTSSAKAVESPLERAALYWLSWGA